MLYWQPPNIQDPSLLGRCGGFLRMSGGRPRNASRWGKNEIVEWILKERHQHQIIEWVGRGLPLAQVGRWLGFYEACELKEFRRACTELELTRINLQKPISNQALVDWARWLQVHQPRQGIMSLHNDVSSHGYCG